MVEALKLSGRKPPAKELQVCGRRAVTLKDACEEEYDLAGPKW